MIRVLVVEDEKDLNTMICDYLAGAGFEADGAFDGDTALKLLERHSWDIVLLDVMLPGADGFELLERLQGRTLPGVILVTARNFESDKLRAFSRGADDYITKPFSLQELEARMRALIRRLPIERYPSDVVSCGFIEMDCSTRTFFLSGEVVELTGFQFDLLLPMVSRPGRVFSREELLEQAGGDGSDAFDRTIDAHIKNIRKRLGTASSIIETVRGAGYRVNPKGGRE